jgi:hypothetical protein
MIFDICENVKATARKGFGEGFGNGIDASSLGTAYHPREVVFFRQLSYLQALSLSPLGY